MDHFTRILSWLLVAVKLSKVIGNTVEPHVPPEQPEQLQLLAVIEPGGPDILEPPPPRAIPPVTAIVPEP